MFLLAIQMFISVLMNMTYGAYYILRARMLRQLDNHFGSLLRSNTAESIDLDMDEAALNPGIN